MSDDTERNPEDQRALEHKRGLGVDFILAYFRGPDDDDSILKECMRLQDEAYNLGLSRGRAEAARAEAYADDASTALTALTAARAEAAADYDDALAAARDDYDAARAPALAAYEAARAAARAVYEAAIAPTATALAARVAARDAYEATLATK